MKLFTLYSRINVLATVIIFMIASIAFYFTLRYVLINQIDDDLRIEEGEIKKYVEQFGMLPVNISVKDQIIAYSPVKDPFDKRFFHSTLMNEPNDPEKEHFRQLVFGIRAAETNYRVSVSKSLEDTDELIKSVALITVITILAMLVVSFIINRFVLKRMWKPFYNSLDMIRDFKVSSSRSLKFTSQKIDEFSHMNQALEKLTGQAQLDYLSLKTFSENASHEIQTPIAIARSKLDLLIQDEKLTEQQSHTVQSAYNAIQRLARLNQSLLLLAKIENNQYEEVQQFDFKKNLQAKLEDFSELWLVHNISTEAKLENAVIQMNPELGDILLNNLFSNATRHNFAGGKIKIVLTAKMLKVENTSHQLELLKDKMYQRFNNSGGTTQSGLGLSIIKQICNVSGFKVDYNYSNDMHAFEISFEKKEAN